MFDRIDKSSKVKYRTREKTPYYYKLNRKHQFT